jgi:small subunit ribosomal protein S6
MLENYEIAVLLKPEMEDKDLQAFIAELKELLTKNGATELGESRLERRPMAYPIKKARDAFYLLINFKSPSSLPQVIRTELKHREGIMRMAFINKPVTAFMADAMAAQPAATPVPTPAPEAVEAKPPEAPDAGTQTQP